VPDALLAKTRERKEDATATHLSDPGKRFHKRSLFDLVRRDRVITKRTFSTIHPSNVERSERRVKPLSGGLMKNAHGVLSVLIASAAVLGGASIARADDHKVTANVPFDFMVGGSRMPAGHYMISTVGDNTAMVAIASTDARRSVYTLTIPQASTDGKAAPQLVFEKVENQYVLRQVTLESSDGHRAVVAPASTTRELIAIASSTHIR
jgi:hypothetical protein